MSTDETITELRARIGTEIGVTDWFTVSQRDADIYAALTDDWDYMHNAPAWAASGPWGGTIAHGMYILSLIPSFLKQTTDLPIVSDSDADGFALNYGFDRVRFVAPLRIGQQARAHIKVLDVIERSPGEHILKTECAVYCDADPERPVMVAENLAYLTFDPTGET